MNNYCSTCLGYIASDPCDGCDGTEENHIYYEPDFVKKDTKPSHIYTEELISMLNARKNTKPRYIDAESFVKQYKGNILTAQTDYAEGFRNALEDIEKAPTADVVEVVRCKNCKYRRKWEGEKSYYCGKDNVAILGNLRPNFYCGFGKRRKDNGKIR